MTDPSAGRRPVPCPLIGMVHLLPLPASPRWSAAGDRRLSMEGVVERAVADARALEGAGFDAVLVENFGDAPFHPERVPAATVAAMTVAVSAVRGAVGVPVGINVLRNDATAALSIAAATGAGFVRVNIHSGGMFTDQGWIEGRAYETLRLRAAVAPGTAILADVFVKHATPPVGLTLAAAAMDTWERGLADALVVSGPVTGAVTAEADLRAVRAAVPQAVVLAGSGVTADTVAGTLRLAHGAIVGSAVEEDGVAGSPVDPERARRLVAAVGS